MYWKMQFLYKIFRQIKCYANQPYLVFFRAETWNTHIFFFGLVLSELKPEAHTYCFCHYKNTTFQQVSRNVSVWYLWCVCSICFKELIAPPTHPKQTKINSLPCLCLWHTHIQGRQKCSMDFRWTAPPNPHKKSLPHTYHKLWTEICEIRQIFKWDLPLPGWGWGIAGKIWRVFTFASSPQCRGFVFRWK